MSTDKPSPANVPDGCPRCGGRLDYAGGELQDDCYTYDVDCPACGWSGYECHQLGPSQYFDANGNEVVKEPTDD